MRGQPDLILVFVNMLCHADEDGVVDRHWRAIADETGLPVERVMKAIVQLEGPDPESRTPTDHGKRIVRIDEHREWGWMIVNYEHYRAMATREQCKAKTRERVRKYREKQKCNADVTKRNDSPSVYASVSASQEGESEGKDIPPEKESVKAYAAEIGFRGWESWFDHFESNGWKVSGKTKMKDWKAALRNGHRRSGEFSIDSTRQQTDSKRQRLLQYEKQLHGYADDLRSLRDASDFIGNVKEAESKFWTKIKDLYGKNFQKARAKIEQFSKETKGISCDEASMSI
jgi:hypothetical protein